MLMDERLVSDPSAAALRLEAGDRVDYQPGDGSRYDVILLSRSGGSEWGRVLVFTNSTFKGATLNLDHEIDCIEYCLSFAPSGGWKVIRPLLAALGAAKGSMEVEHYDGNQEHDARLSYDGEPLNRKDARLGRKLRRMMEDDQ